MREIRFRGKRLDNGKWVYGHYLYRLGHHVIYVDEGTQLIKVDGETVGQFTGLKDKSETPVFEGDIVKLPYYQPLLAASKGATIWEDETVVVTWNIEHACWGRYNDGSGMLTENWGGAGSAEVIGNIYENAELLTSKAA